MNNDYIIRNFRVFDEEGVTIPIKPITMLTGCNSSGKSSIVKSMVLLNSYLQEIRNDFSDRQCIDLEKYILNFSSRDNVTLGGFNRVLHRNSKVAHFDLGYVVHSLLLGENVKVTFRFGTISNDDLNNGHILGFSIENLSGEIIYKSILGDKNEGNLNLVRDNFYRYVWGQFLVWEFRDDKRTPKNHYQSIFDPSESAKMNPFYEEYGEDAINDIVLRENIIPQLYPNLLHDRSNTFAEKYLRNDLGLLNMAKESGSLFFVPTLTKIAHRNKNRMYRLEDRIKKDGDLIKDTIKVFDDFYSSDFKDFGSYYLQKEYDFLNFTINWEHNSSLLFTPHLLAIPDYNNWKDKYFRDADEIPQVTDFINVYDSLMLLDSKLRQGTALDTHFDLYSRRRPRVFEMFKDYVSQFISEVITISMPHDLSYVSSSLVKIKSSYSLEDTDDFTILLKKYFTAKTVFSNNKDAADEFKPGSFINKWIRKFGIGDSIKLSVVEGGTGVSIRLYKNKRDKTGSLLSEQGYGITQLFVVLLRIETAIMEAHTFHMFSSNCLLDPMQVEEEFSHLFRAYTTIAIEEPEVHQHPKFQSMLADVFVDAYLNYNVHFIIETHSEYLIRKIQNIVAKRNVDKSDITFMYVYDSDPRKREGKPQINIINICSDGRLADGFGEGFFDEADRLARNLLYIKTYGHEKA